LILEPISKRFEEDNEAGDLDKSEEVGGMILPADENAALPWMGHPFGIEFRAKLFCW
jgi:hypothetical protein